MAIKAGQILHVMNRFIVDRLQTAGANLNIPTERIYELGNYQSVAVIRDIPDLTFNLDSLDVDTEVEALLTGYDVDVANAAIDDAPGGGLMAAAPWGSVYNFADNRPVDIISPMKSAYGAFDVVKGVAVPHLTLESASYRYGVRDNAGEQFSLRGDTIFYTPGSPRMEYFEGNGVLDTFSFANTALKYVEQGVDYYALSVLCKGYRLVHSVDYTDTATGFTLTPLYIENHGLPAVGDILRVVYATATVDTYDQTVHEPVSIKPAAIKGKDIQVYIGTFDDGGTPAAFRWSDVQSVNVDWSISLEDDYEFGNPRAVARDATDAPEVSGSVEIKPMDAEALFSKLRKITGVADDEVIGPQSSVVVPLEVRLMNPDSGGVPEGTVLNGKTINPGTVLKTLYVPDARFTIPGYEGRSQQKSMMTMNFESDAGILEVIKGSRADIV